MRIFQLNTNQLNEIKEQSTNRKFTDYEKTLQNLIEKNLTTVFPGVLFVKTEYKIEDLRPDTIAFDKDKRQFVIIEYKNVKKDSLIDQGISYYQVLIDRKAEFVLLYNETFGVSRGMDYFDWDKIRVIFISPRFTTYQKRASGYQGLPIELYEIKRYENNIITLNSLNETDKAQLQARQDRQKILRSKAHAKSMNRQNLKKPQLQPKISEYSEVSYLNGQYGNTATTPETKKLWSKLKERILGVNKRIEFRQKKTYASFYISDTRHTICTIEALKHKIKLTYNTKDKEILSNSEFVVDVTGVGHYGLGNFMSTINNTEDITAAIPIIERVYLSKAS